MSAFVKRQPSRAVDLGTRPGLNGQVLISTGVAGIDKLLGGGLPLGCVLLLVEDSQSQQHLNLLKCFMGEGICCKHSLALISGEHLSVDDVAGFLPAQAKSSSSSSTSSSTPTSSQGALPSTSGAGSRPTASVVTAPGGSAAEPAEDGLKIAWQYRKYIQNQHRTESGTQQQADRVARSSSSSSSRSSSAAGAAAIAAGVGREWCHQFDLTKGVTPEAVQASKLQLSCCCAPQQQQQQGGAAAMHAAAVAAEQFLARFQPVGPIPVPSRDPASIGRLVLQSLGSPDWWPRSSSSSSSSNPTSTSYDSSTGSSSSWQSLEGSMLAAVARLRLAVQDATCAAVVTCPAGLYSKSFQVQLEHLADVVLCVQGLADNSDIYRLLPDATSAVALLEVRRVPELGLLRQRYSEDRLYVIRAKRRSVSVGILDLVPLEASESAAADNGSKSEKPAAAQICGSGPSGANSCLDF